MLTFRLATLCLAGALLGAGEAEAQPHRAMTLTEALSPYVGPVVKGVDTTTVDGKVMAGYQGWFMAKGDGYEPGWVHWGGVDQNPPRASFDLWPDMTELPPSERFASGYRYADGTRGELFSSTVKETVLRHFEWMKQYGIDGVWVQRFTSCVSNQNDWNYLRTTAVLSHCREGANRTGRAFAVMYDTDFDRRAIDAMKSDWTRLVREMKLLDTPAYIKHRGGPVIALWGYGFDHRKFDPVATREFFEWLKKPENGACTIMLGIPNDWVGWTDERMTLLRQYGQIISPWNVGRYGTLDGASAHAKRYWPADLAFCRANDKDYYAVAFPGFSWTNLMKGNSPLNQIPRQGGRFLWRQIEEIRRYGMKMVYIAMFDEVDEGTAVFKVTNQPPQGRFGTYEGLPSDHYLRLCGLAGRYLRGEDVTFPEVQPDPAQMTYRPIPQLAYYQQPSRFLQATRDRWKQLLDGVPIVLHDEPYSEWISDLYNAGSLDMRLSTWADILAKPDASKLMVFAAGNESFGAPDAQVPAIVERARQHLRGGGVVLVAGGGGYPLFYPGGSTEAAKFGFRLQMVNSPAGSRVKFDPALGTDVPAFQLKSAGSSRLMRKTQYPGAPRYVSLARVDLPDGTANGDALAAVQPGGDLGQGWIVYVAADLLQCPDRETLLDALLNWLRPRLNG
ncbi:MAG: hypothetical protein HZB16_14500 [Armatimonadetes bacterium]|nr:hypothetical protein [Armatimonadota bacterium]